MSLTLPPVGLAQGAFRKPTAGLHAFPEDLTVEFGALCDIGIKMKAFQVAPEQLILPRTKEWDTARDGG
jgi:hypothetical protein